MDSFYVLTSGKLKRQTRGKHIIGRRSGVVPVGSGLAGGAWLMQASPR
jgi:hypothetical protein